MVRRYASLKHARFKMREVVPFLKSAHNFGYHSSGIQARDFSQNDYLGVVVRRDRQVHDKPRFEGDSENTAIQ